MARQIIHIGQSTLEAAWVDNMFRLAAAAGECVYERTALQHWNRDHHPNTATNEDYARLTEILSAYREQPAILSFEKLGMWPPEPFLKAVHAALPGSGILLLTRSPEAYVRDQYWQRLVRTTESVSLEGFVTGFRGHLRRSHNILGWVKAAKDVYKGNPLKLLPYELMDQNQNAFVAELGAIVGFSLQRYQVAAAPMSVPSPEAVELLRQVNEAVEAQKETGKTKAVEYKTAFLEKAGNPKALAAFIAPDIAAAEGKLDEIDWSAVLPKALPSLLKPIRPRAPYAAFLDAYGLGSDDTVPAA